jgi:hypothetical protein
MDKVPTAIVILVGTVVLSIIAGFNANLGKFLLAFMLIVGMVWLIGSGTQSDLTRWLNLGKTSNVQAV